MAKKKKSKSMPIAVVALIAAGAVAGGGNDNEKTTAESPVPTSGIVEIVEPAAETPIVEIENEENTVSNVSETYEAVEKSAPAEAVDLEQAFRDSLTQYNYVASSESDKYHKPSCRWTKEINNGNLIHFNTIQEAQSAGYTACGTCKPK